MKVRTNSFRWSHGLHFIFIGCVALLCAMGGEDSTSGPLVPGYVPLVEEAGKYVGSITDSKGTYEVHEVSFSGETKLKEIPMETTDGYTILDLSSTQEIRIRQPHYRSKSYGDRIFTLVDITKTNGETQNSLLIPEKTNVSAIIKRTNQETGWFIHDLKVITLDHSAHDVDVEKEMPAPPAPEFKDEGILEKAAGAAKSVGEAVVSAVKRTGEYLSEAVS